MNTIYLETSVLVGSGWPRPSSELTNLAHMARMHGVRVVMPLAVELELEAQWVRETQKRGKKIAASIGDFNRQTKTCLPPISDMELPSGEELRRQYREQIQTIKEGFRITVIPVSNKPLDVIYEMAIKLTPPFEEKGIGFKDTVILLSVLDHLESDLELQGALIAKDKMFGKALEFFPAASDRLKVYKEIKAVYDILFERMAGRYFEVWQIDRRQIKLLLEQRIAELQQFIESNLEIDPSQLSGLVQLVKSIDIGGIKEDTLQAPIPRPKAAQVVPISFEVDVKLHVIVRKFPSTIAPPFKVGEAPQPRQPRGLMDMAGDLMRDDEEEILDGIVKVESAATFDNEYKDIQFNSVSLKTQGFGLGLFGLGSP